MPESTASLPYCRPAYLPPCSAPPRLPASCLVASWLPTSCTPPSCLPLLRWNQSIPCIEDTSPHQGAHPAASRTGHTPFLHEARGGVPDEASTFLWRSERLSSRAQLSILCRSSFLEWQVPLPRLDARARPARGHGRGRRRPDRPRRPLRRLLAGAVRRRPRTWQLLHSALARAASRAGRPPVAGAWPRWSRSA